MIDQATLNVNRSLPPLREINLDTSQNQLNETQTTSHANVSNFPNKIVKNPVFGSNGSNRQQVDMRMSTTEY